MKFRLIYSGPLNSTQGEPRGQQRNPMAPHKHQIRKVLHRQLKQLWETNRFLTNKRVTQNFLTRVTPLDGKSYWGSSDKEFSLSEVLAGHNEKFGYKFVPLVAKGFQLLCSLDILFLRCDPPGSLLQTGDLDNRVKTLIDALRFPMSEADLKGNEVPDQDEDPFFCLMEDDSQVTSIRVETDVLLDRSTVTGISDTMLVITVELHPFNVNTFNLNFA